MKPLIIIITAIALTSCSIKTKPWTRAEKTLAYAGTVAATWNLYETEQALDDPTTIELNPLYGERPSDSQVVGYFAVSHIVMLTLAHFFDTIYIPGFGECEFRTPLIIGKGALNIGLAIHDRSIRQ